ncbi:hypothetical protein EYB53_017640 [Candidatus Chloroploca sp. M-50]|uniref:Uncharacterized protein n=1 Tax=Candidatus Chloroploca mongolica TaxID=2528176 RepID=A0ABS4DDL7_9CHLR|nr:hypothetical protein [Candidatus Chloroploca mongolica]MBP1467540.1 hypothetical protein [Candidatus Chloroploca mongolica]
MTTVSNYQRYQAATFNQPAFYPLQQVPDPIRYQPLGAWLGRLILPSLAERELVLGCWIELEHVPAAYQDLLAARVRLRWLPNLTLNARFWGATRSVHMSEDSLKAIEAGTVLAERVNGWEYVNPLESLAGAHPLDDLTVRLEGQVTVDRQPADGGPPIIFVTTEPVQVTGRFYALVQFLGPSGDGDAYRVRHYDQASSSFTGPEELVRMPEVVPDSFGVTNSTASGIEHSPLNAQGWYIYGAQDAEGAFVVRALAPRLMLRLEPQSYADRTSECMEYLKPKQWKQAAVKGQATTVLLAGDGITPHAARAAWQAGDRALVIHLFGGIGGEKREPAARTPLYWGHVAFGRATVILEPLANELSFDLVYNQVYAHNVDGLTAGSIHYSRYSGDRQLGWAGVRPIQDVLIKHPAVTDPFELGGQPLAALDLILRQLEVMTARYRIADGRGGTSVGAANNCAQDSAQALYAAIRNTGRLLRDRPDLQAALANTPENARRLETLLSLGSDVREVLTPWGAREDWEYDLPILGSGGTPLKTLGKAVRSWRTVLPPVIARALIEVFLKRGASAWVLRSSQIGGHDPSIEPIVPNV